MAVRPKGPGSDFQSKLGSGIERFLSRIVVRALEDHWRSAEDFLRHFPPLELMESLEAAPDLRAELLVNAAGVHERIASKKSVSSGAEDLQIALDEGICDATKVLELVPPDDRVRYLSHSSLWNFSIEDEFWTGLNAEADPARAGERITFVVEAAIQEGLVSLQEVTDGIGFDTISERLPVDELRRVLRHAFEGGRNGQPLTEESLLEILPLRTLISFLSLEHVWDHVVIARVAGPGGLTTKTVNPRAERKPERIPSRPPPPPSADLMPDAHQLRKSVPPPKPVKRSSVPPPPPPPPLPALPTMGSQPLDLDVGVDELMEGAPARSNQEQDARRRVTDKLASIERLPPNHESLPTPILLSIESMYAELPTLPTDEEREACIRESFPNEAHLTQAMLALIELLDPSIDITDPVIRDADVESLMKVVLFEERHRSDQGRPSQLPSSGLPPPPPAPGRKRSVVPPPLPRSPSGPPPLPRSDK
jgi:hypothetical protein